MDIFRNFFLDNLIFKICKFYYISYVNYNHRISSTDKNSGYSCYKLPKIYITNNSINSVSEIY
jgi:hypothetical protein